MIPKTFKTKTYPNIQVTAATINKHNPKTVYFTIRAYYMSESEMPLKQLRKFILNIRHSISEGLNNSIFKDKFLVIDDIPDTFIETYKAFVNLEFTLYPKKIYDLKLLQNEVNNIINKVYNENYSNQSEIKIRKYQKENS